MSKYIICAVVSLCLSFSALRAEEKPGPDLKKERAFLKEALEWLDRVPHFKVPAGVSFLDATGALVKPGTVMPHAAFKNLIDSNKQLDAESYKKLRTYLEGQINRKGESIPGELPRLAQPQDGAEESNRRYPLESRRFPKRPARASH